MTVTLTLDLEGSAPRVLAGPDPGVRVGSLVFFPAGMSPRLPGLMELRSTLGQVIAALDDAIQQAEQ